MDIVNYLKISDLISTSGQPRAEHFRDIAGQGFKTVINLALPTSDYALPDEGALVTGLGMNYIHIPVLWESPRTEQYETFAALLKANSLDKVWVHCVMNMRVSCFLYLYHRKVEGMPEPEARALMRKIWEPNETWRKFLKQVEKEFS